MSFRRGERRDGSRYTHPVSDDSNSYGGKPLEVTRVPAVEVKKGILDSEPEGFVVHILSLNGDGTVSEESIPVIAYGETKFDKYHQALAEAFEESESTGSPIVVNIVDPTLEEVIAMAVDRGTKGAIKIKEMAITGGERAREVAERAYDVAGQGYGELRRIGTAAGIAGREIYEDVREVAESGVKEAERLGKKVHEVAIKQKYRTPTGQFSKTPYGVWKGVDVLAKGGRRAIPIGRGVASGVGRVGKRLSTSREDRLLQQLDEQLKLGRITKTQYHALSGPIIARTIAKKPKYAGALGGAKRMLDEAQVKFWVQDAYSKDPETRRYARMRLRQRAPEVYDIMDFSSPSFDARRSYTGYRGRGTGSTLSYIPVSPVLNPKGARPYQIVFDPSTNKYLRVQEERTAGRISTRTAGRIPTTTRSKWTTQVVGNMRSPIA